MKDNSLTGKEAHGREEDPQEEGGMLRVQGWGISKRKGQPTGQYDRR